MHAQLLDALRRSTNEAADELLVEGLRRGLEPEQRIILTTLLTRKTRRGLAGVIGEFDRLPDSLQIIILQNLGLLHTALRECGRAEQPELRLAAMKLIALGREGKLAYVLSENLHDADERLSKAAAEALVALARWVATTQKKIQKTPSPNATAELPSEPDRFESLTSAGVGLIAEPEDRAALYADLMAHREDIESAIARALDVHRGRHSQDLLRAALLVCNWPGSKTLGILHTAKHGGQSPMVRRLQQAPAAEHVEAFLLGATHGQLRLHFGTAFSHINEAPVLDALLRKTHWVKDHQLQLCLHQVTRGTWWGELELRHDIERRDPGDACKIGQWLAVSGMHDAVQDERFALLAEHAAQHVGGRLALLRLAMARKRGSSVRFFRTMLNDPDERLMRLAAREIIRRRPPEFENMLLQLMTGAPESVRKVISRAIGQAGFEQFWQRFDKLDRPTRRQAGRAMLKLLPDATLRLTRRLTMGPIEQRLKAMQVAHELGLAEQLRQPLVALAEHSNPKVRSKVVSVLGELPDMPIDTLMERVLHDADARVRANAIEVLEGRSATNFLPLLAQRANQSQNRERANAIKALNTMKVGNVGPQLLAMLRDQRPEHKVSAMWALKQMGWWRMLTEVGKLAKEDGNVKVRRYAVNVLKGVAELVQQQKRKGKAG